MSDAVAPLQEPQLQFRLVGGWHPVILNDLDSADLISRYATEIVGRQDDRATLRLMLRNELSAAAESARGMHAKAMFVMTELKPGTAVPVTLTVFAQPELRMAPAIGVGPEAVIGMLERSFAELKRPGYDTAVRMEIPGSAIMRTHQITEQRREAHPDDDQLAEGVLDELSQMTLRRLSVDYWYTVPGSKNILLVNFATPLGDIPHVMLGFFDSIVKASYFELPDAEGADASEQPSS